MSADTQSPTEHGLTRVIEAVVHSRDVSAAVAFHRSAFDLQVLVDSAYPGVVMGVPGSSGGRVRIIETAAPDALDPPAVWDFGPRLLGIYTRDLDATVEQAEAAGGHALEKITYTYGAGEMREVVLHGVDGIWWTVPQVPSAPMVPRPSPALEGDPVRTHSELHSAVLVVDDHEATVKFFVDGGGMTALFDGTMTGEDFEKLVGMPSGASMRLAFLVGPDQAPGRVEIMSFIGVDAVDRSGDTIGLRRLVMGARDVTSTRATLIAAGGTPLSETVILGPAGIEIELVDDAPR